MAQKRPMFSYDSCIACGICVQCCPVSALVLTKTDVDAYKKAYPRLCERPCIGCSMCEGACPMEAIAMEEEAS